MEANNKPIFVPSSFSNREEDIESERFRKDYTSADAPSAGKIRNKGGFSDEYKNNHDKSDSRGDPYGNVNFKRLESECDFV